jgi:hypothetical protein
VIDPGLAYSTFLGGSALDEGFGIAVDRAGDAFVTGLTASADYPTSVGPFDPTANGDVDAFVTKLSASGTALVYSTLLGGSGADAGADIAVDGHGSAYVTGSTDSADFPTSSSAFDQTFAGGGPFGGGDAFAAKLDPSGSDLTYATFLGGTGSDEGRGIAVDCAGRAFVVGSTESVDLPATPGAADRTYNGGGDAFVTKFNASGSGLDYSTFLGGTAYDPGFGIAVDDAGSAYVTGATSSADYPLTPGAVDSTPGSSDAFVTKLDASGSALDYSTRLGGSAFDEGLGVAVGADGSAYVTGQTGSADFPTTADAFDAVWDAPSTDAFVTKLNAAGTAAAYSTLLGGTGPEGGQDVAVDAHGNAYVTGQTDSGDYPTTPDALAGALNGAAPDAFVTELDASGAALAYSTLIGGTGLDEGHDIALGPRGRVYITGLTSSADFPTTPAAVDGSPATGSYDAFVTKLETAARGVAEAETCTGRRGGSPTSPRGSRILSARAPCA